MNSQVAHLHIASFILLTKPDALAQVIEHLTKSPEVEVVTSDVSGKIVFLVEAQHERRIMDIVDALRELSVVLSVSMVEHHVDELSAMLEEISP